MATRKRSGFTLVELLVVITIIGILIALLLPAVQAAREAARRMQCTNNLKQMGLALHNYHTTWALFPPGIVGKRSRDTSKRQLAWSLFILPYLEQQAIYDQFDQNLAYDHADNDEATSHVIDAYICPSTNQRFDSRKREVTGQGRGAIDYGGMFGPCGSFPDFPCGGGVMTWENDDEAFSVAIADIRDGTSNTIVIGEDSGRDDAQSGAWADGENIFDQCGPINVPNISNEINSDHPGGANALFADGSVHFLSESMDLNALLGLCTRARGEVIPASAF